MQYNIINYSHCAVQQIPRTSASKAKLFLLCSSLYLFSDFFLPQNVLELLPWTHRLLQGYPYLWVIAKVDVLWQNDGRKLFYHLFLVLLFHSNIIEVILAFLLFFFFSNFIFFLNFTILYQFCQISKWIRHRYTCVPHPEPSSLLPPHTISLGRPSALAPSIQYRASNLDWQLVSYMILYVFQCHSPKSSHPLLLPSKGL